jgi:hypothetical protein
VTTTPVLISTAAGLVERPVRPWDRWLVKLRGHGLDRRISAGEPTDNDLLTAARARDLIGRRYRRKLASCWQDMVRACDAIRSVSDPRVPVSRVQVRQARPEIDELVRRLQSGLPVSARGIAMATLLLTDGAGPIYRRTAPTLAAVLRDVVAAIDPLTELDALTS